jgi:hypothetical protein
MVNATTLRQAKYKLKTALGVTDTYITHSTACGHSMVQAKEAETHL